MPKCANVYAVGDAFLARSLSRVERVHWIGTGPSLRLPIDCGDNVLGDAVLSALEQSQESVPYPGPGGWKVVGKPLLKAAKLRSWKALAESAYLVGVSLDAGQFQVTPWISQGAKLGFGIGEPSIQLVSSENTASILGAEVRRMMERSRELSK